MRQEREGRLESKEKFEDGLLRVDACFERHNYSRENEYLRPDEDISLSFGRSAVWEEKQLLNKVAELLSKGIRPKSGQSLEKFVADNISELEEVI